MIAINQTSNLVRLKRTSGVATPGIYTVFNYYQDPFRSKIVNVRFGAHEYNIVYIKGIAEASNLLSDQWSTPVKFSTDDLILNGSEGQSQIEFINYYHNYIVDWGANMIAEAKEHKISAWYGKTPNAPVINGDDFRVVQINTQINAAIDTTDVKNTAAEIESTKSQITSLKNTIAAQKTDLQSAADLYTYNSIQQQIATNTTDLNNLQVTYTTLVDNFQTIVKENAAVLTDPKFHIRGFFPIPALKYYDEAETVAEQIIGFDICYRYIKEDSTATQLNTFTYTDGDGISKVTGTFTDWVIVSGPMREKVYDENMQRYVWRSENIADGTETNINQVDIPISKGEKVEIKVRSISEAGYPENPLKSPWSNSVIIEFPPTLSVSNEIADLIKMVNDDALQITINNILDSVGISVHLNDVVANTNSVTGEYYKHLAKSIAYEEKKIENGITTVNSISIQDKLDEFIRLLKNEVSTNEKQQVQLDELDRIQKLDHESFNSSLNKIFHDVSVNVERIDRELSGKVAIAEQTEIKKNLVLNASSDTVETHVVLKSNEWKNAEGNPLSMSVMTRNVDDQGGSYCGVEVSEVYVYPDGRTSETPVPLYENMMSNRNSINRLNSSLSKTDEKVNKLENIVPTLTLNSSFVILEDDFTALKNRVDEVLIEDNIHAKGAVYINNNKVKLTTTQGEGALQVFIGQSDTNFGDIHSKNVMLFPEGKESGESISMVKVYDDLNDTMDQLKEVELQVTTIQEKYIDPVISYKGNIYNVTANKITGDELSTPSLKIINEDNIGYMTLKFPGDGVLDVNYVDTVGKSTLATMRAEDFKYTIDGSSGSLSEIHDLTLDIERRVKALQIALGVQDGTVNEFVDFMKEAENISTTVTSLQSTVSSLQTQITSLSGKISTLEGSIKGLGDRVAALEAGSADTSSNT